MALPRRIFTDAELVEWKRAISDIYACMKAKAANGPYDIEYGGIPLTVLPSVYAPQFFDDSLWYADRLRRIVGRSSMLEIGTGTGAIAILCRLDGAKVVGSDVNLIAVKNARENARRNSVRLPVVVGDMYDPLQRKARFDYIFWAHPFNSWEEPTGDPLLRTGIDPKYRSLRRYIAGAKHHLRPKGRLLLGTGDSADLDMVAEIARENGYDLKLLAESDRPLGGSPKLSVKDLLVEFVPAHA